MNGIPSASRALPQLRVFSLFLARRHASAQAAAARATTRQASPRPVTNASAPAPSPRPSLRHRLPQRSRNTLDTLEETSRLSNKQMEKQGYAQKMYEQGRTVMYRSPSHVGVYTTSYLMGGSAITTALTLAYSNLWMYDEIPDLHWLVPWAYRLGLMVFTAIGGFFLLQSGRFVKKIDLVQVDGLVKMAVQVARPLPFLRPRVSIIAPYEFVMDRRVTWTEDSESRWLTDPAVQVDNTGQGFSIGGFIGQIFSAPFFATRKLLTSEGFVFVRLGNESGTVKLDTQGTLSRNGWDLIEMGTMQS